MTTAIRVLGLGNPMAGDDAAGLLAARRLKAELAGRADVVEADVGGLDMLDLVQSIRALILIDAVRSGCPAGTVHRLDASAGPVAADLFPHSTHAFTAADAIELGRVLGLLPPTVIVYGVEAGTVAAGARPCPAVVQAVSAVAERVRGEVERLLRADPPARS